MLFVLLFILAAFLHSAIWPPRFFMVTGADRGLVVNGTPFLVLFKVTFEKDYITIHNKLRLLLIYEYWIVPIVYLSRGTLCPG